MPPERLVLSPVIGWSGAIIIFFGMSWHLLFFFVIGGFLSTKSVLGHTIACPSILSSPLLPMSVGVIWFYSLTY